MSNPPTDQEVMAHICQILEFDGKAAVFLETNQIKLVRRFATTTVDIYQQLTNKSNSPINSTDIGEVNLFRIWYTNIIQNKEQPTNQELVDKLTTSTWDNICSQYFIYIQDQKNKAAQAALAPQTPQTQAGKTTPITIAPSTPSLKVALKDYPITTGKESD